MRADELIQAGLACRSAGDVDGELAAYREADALGDAEAALRLGDLLRGRGSTEQAAAAYLRAEERGHDEAGMHYSWLLRQSGDKDAAIASCQRSVANGSPTARVTLGLMLAEAGEPARGLQHLADAAESDDANAHWALGRILELPGNWSAAAHEYLEAAKGGDATSAFRMGVCLRVLGDNDGAMAALEWASDLGYAAADDALADLREKVERKGPMTEAVDVRDLWGNVTALYAGLAAQRQDLGRQWIAASLVVQEHEARLAALEAAHADERREGNIVLGRFRVQLPPNKEFFSSTEIPSPSSDAWLERRNGQARAFQLAEDQRRAFDRDLESARLLLQQAESKTLGASLRKKGTAAMGRFSQRLDGLAEAITVARARVADAEQDRRSSALESAAQAHHAFEPTKALAESSASQLPTILQPWSSSAWDSWSLEGGQDLGLRLARGGVLVPKPDKRVGENARFGTDLRIPWGFSLHDSWYLTHDDKSRSIAHGFIRSLMLRHLLAEAPGEVRFCVFDPVGLGQSAGDLLDLAEYDPDLIGGKVWSSPRDLDARLTELTAHIELVIQKYLRATYQTIDEFNDAAGEVAEPYRVLVLFDFPAGLTGESAARLKSILENGPRCGVFTMILADSTAQTPHGIDPSTIAGSASRQLNLDTEFSDDIDGYQLETSFEPEVLPDRSDVARRIIDSIGRASVNRTESALTFDKVFRMYGNSAARGLQPELGAVAARTDASEPNSWWQDDTTRGLFAPIGQRGARDVAVLGFDSSDRAGALLVGRPGSGKSTLLHTYIAGLTTLYGPDELELYLIDFKEGVEFKSYAEEQLPHAKVIAIESDREFGLSVLESLQAEIQQRAEILRATGGRQVGMEGLRKATGDTIPRVLLIFDEFQVLFARNDRLGLAAADLLESIIRQGRGFGVHVLLGSQSLAGLDALGAHVPQLLPVRILLPAAESDARKVLGDANNAGDYITGHGQGVLNTAGGAVEANVRFRGALLPEPDRIARLQVMRDKANSAGFSRVPSVFEGNSLIPLDTHEPMRFREELTATGTNPLRLRSGSPMTVGDIGDLVLAREAGANVLAIARGGVAETAGLAPATGAPFGLLTSAVASATIGNAAVDVIDFMSNDDGLDDLLEPLIEARLITLKRRRAFPDVLNKFAEEVEERVNLDDATRQPKVLFLFGIHRARDLDTELGSLDADGDLVDTLEFIMRDGPEFGIHVWIWSDSVTGASRRLSPRMMRELAWRIAGKMSSDDSQTFIGTGQAADLRESQLLIVNDDRAVTTRLTAYDPPTPSWLRHVMLQGRSE